MTTKPLRWLVGGFLVVQLAWLLASPPFGGIDEFDHSFRATAVAHGQWFAEPSDATRGTGATVRTPEDIVAAAAPECERLVYIPDSECHGEPVAGSDLREVPSGAGRYNPAFYAVVGTASLPFEGFTALYAMRLATVLLCALFFALACRVTLKVSDRGWMLAGLVVAVTPIVIYSSSVVAPNGPEMLAALAVWAGLLALASDPRVRSAGAVPGLLPGLVLAMAGLALFRSLGTFWLVAIIGVVGLLVIRIGGVRDVVGNAWRSRRFWIVAGATTATVAAGVAWTLTLSSYRISINDEDRVFGAWEIVGKLAWEPVLWVLQSIGAFPLRNDPAPLGVYALELAVFVGLLGWGILWGERRVMAVAGLVVVASLVIPFVIAAGSYNTYGDVWQGRYTLPLALGVPLIVGLALDRSTYSRQLGERMLVVAAVMIAVAHGWSVWHVAKLQGIGSPLADSSDWITGPPLVLGLLATAGGLALGWGVRCHVQARQADQEPDRARSEVAVP